jgi:hypothetical protein
VARPTRFERVASTFGGWHSIQLSYGRISLRLILSTSSGQWIRTPSTEPLVPSVQRIVLVLAALRACSLFLSETAYAMLTRRSFQIGSLPRERQPTETRCLFPLPHKPNPLDISLRRATPPSSARFAAWCRLLPLCQAETSRIRSTHSMSRPNHGLIFYSIKWWCIAMPRQWNVSRSLRPQL